MHRQLSIALFSLSFGIVGAFVVRDHNAKVGCQGLWENMTSQEAWQVFFPKLDYPFSDRVNTSFRSLGACCLCCTCNILEVCQEYHITQKCCTEDPTIYINCCTTERDFHYHSHHHGRSDCSMPHKRHNDS